MDFNLTKLLKAVNTKFSYPKDGAVEFLLAKEGIIAKMGEVTYYFDHEKLQAVLDGNGFNGYYKDETQDLANEILSKHIINQLQASLGKKVYPEIKTISSDLNQH